MELLVIGSGSKGNCYLLKSEDGEVLMLEAGVNFKEVKKALDFKICDIVGCYITHEHGDHAGHAQKVIETGIKTHASKGTIEGMKAEHQVHVIKHGEVSKSGKFLIVPFNTIHDTREPLGFLIQHPEMGTALFLTDSEFVEYKFSNLSHILIECNYSEELIAANYAAGKIPASVRERVTNSHMELETVKELLAANNLRKVRTIVLLHLSDRNADAAGFQKDIAAHTGKDVWIAEKGLRIGLNKTPF